jgi:hypothetical protein
MLDTVLPAFVSPVAMSFALKNAMLVSERTTLPTFNGRSCHGNE